MTIPAKYENGVLKNAPNDGLISARASGVERLPGAITT